ncbi:MULTISPECIES: DUF456 domain-containing protein [Mammaliicoccus]|uniref:DUF456 domain-containing protein n=1 Tax=Mammaliicoccus fleurettii TaxID=150056 RepID=A0ABS5ML60_9STAP|nr:MULTISPECIES: DUF456 domain-containing protein [Mammaliicoccus]HCN60378.1 DUF456 domain-containing protein [Staphylococcus sp.]MBL0846322.1 DUF456 domain-containing protein [Mammaliicoccus fleurettii]MBO3061686.1 DUF456 domain-containing protein [Mammaliicoccus fleurettii]MBS3671398.1 DUF456 domain-containing protein [Mammaliicoccus fleurettii]MBS3696648.1 DUF456 domain-containing protein [Mammaliicoccus fleurettii]
MTAISWILIILMFVIAFVGLIKPIIPSVLFLWVGYFIYHFAIDSSKLSWIFWTVMVVLTIFMILSDIIMNSYFVKKFGGSKLGETMAAVGVIIGCFVFPPFGIIIVPFVLVFVTEMIQKNDISAATNASIGSLLGFLTSSIAKALIMLVMVVWFFIDIIF